MTVIMTIMMFGKNTSSPVTCLDLLCCAKPVGLFQKNHIWSMLAPLPCCPICFILGVWEPEHRGVGICECVMMATHTVTGSLVQ